MSASTANKYTGNGKLSGPALMQRAAATADANPPSPALSCSGSIHVGLFFDGTNNNQARDEKQWGHSNVVRLYNAFRDDPAKGFFPIYIPGVGTPFPEIGELGESTAGNAFARGGARRIHAGLLRLYDAAYAFFMQDDKFKDLKSKTSQMAWQTSQLNGLAQLKALLAPDIGVLKDLAENQQKKLLKINVYVFGFSRGAAEARAFVNWLKAVCEKDSAGELSFAGIPLAIPFMGIFDTVASVGVPDSVAVVDGHLDWAFDNMHVPRQVGQCVHYVAAHEQRASFPLDSVRDKNAYPFNCREVVYPGMHSDVGSGYSPGEQGRSRKAKRSSDMLGQIPLLQMYEEARKAGVPLLSIGEMRTRRKLKVAGATIADDFALDENLRNTFNAYLDAAGSVSGTLEEVVHNQTLLYLRWRRLRLHDMNKISSIALAHEEDPQGKVDLLDSHAEFNQRVAELEAATEKDLVSDKLIWVMPTVWAGDRLRKKAFQLLVWQQYQLWQQVKARPLTQKAVIDLFDNYAHDSRAGFHITGNDGDSSTIDTDKNTFLYRREYFNSYLRRRNVFFGTSLTTLGIVIEAHTRMAYTAFDRGEKVGVAAIDATKSAARTAGEAASAAQRAIQETAIATHRAAKEAAVTSQRAVQETAAQAYRFTEEEVVKFADQTKKSVARTYRSATGRVAQYELQMERYVKASYNGIRRLTE